MTLSKRVTSKDMDERLKGFTLYQKARAQKSPKGLSPMVVIVAMLAFLSPYVAVGVVGGAALQQLYTRGRSMPRRQRVFDWIFVGLMIVMLVQYPATRLYRAWMVNQVIEDTMKRLEEGQKHFRTPGAPEMVTLPLANRGPVQIIIASMPASER